MYSLRSFGGDVFLLCGSVSIILISVFTNCMAERKQLDDYILHYEDLNYDRNVLHEMHMRHKRSRDTAVFLRLNAFNKDFELKLLQDALVFAPNFMLEFNGTTAKPDLSFLYTGEVIGHPGSTAHGAIIQGQFSGSFSIPIENETYHIEKCTRFFCNKSGYHSVIYRESDMNLDPFRERRTRERREAHGFGSDGYANALKWMKEVVQSEVVSPNKAKRYENHWQKLRRENQSGIYRATANSRKVHQRIRQETLSSVNKGNYTCSLSLMSDIFLWNEYLRRAFNNSVVAMDEILAFFASHIKALKLIFESTTFVTYDGTKSYSNITFSVQKTKVMTNADCSSTSPLSSFCQSHIGVNKFLDLSSLINQDEFCLAYLFTYRDFKDGTLGMAWIGHADSRSGGVCARNKMFTKNSIQVSKSMNTGFVTTLNYGKEVPPKSSQSTFAHEVGHNFGSQHDTEGLCAPYGFDASDANQGNYIKFPIEVMGDKMHDNQFSVCSKDSIARVLDAVLTKPYKFNCFTQSGPFCGNGVVEAGEQCDCGYHGECNDKCCVARDAPGKSTFCVWTKGSNCRILGAPYSIPGTTLGPQRRYGQQTRSKQ